MLVNADLSLRAAVTPRQYQWIASPQPGVERVMLDRVGGEKGRATSIVRYAPDSWFPEHQHPAGEEILVLSGNFSEGDTHYPAGWYLRSPPGSCHQPSSAEGAVIFVKLGQMQRGESRPVRVDTRDVSRWTVRNGRECCPLFSDGIEHVSLERIPASAAVFGGPVESAEILLVEGSLRERAQEYERGSWVRLPPGTYPDLVAGGCGASVYLKTGRLANPVSLAGA